MKNLENIKFNSCYYVGNSFCKIDNIPYKMNPIEYYSYETFPKSKAIVIHYNSCFDNKNKPFYKFSDEIFNYIRYNKNLLEINNIVVDLRYNNGGADIFFQYFINELKNYRNENKNLKIHIIIGKNTYSSGAGIVYSLMKYFKDVTIYGYPLAGGMKQSGDVSQDILPNSKLIFNYGQNFFDITKENRDLFTEEEINENALIPDFILKPTIKDYVDNRDYVLEKILDKLK